jgi:signal transduction histidine kinase
LNEDVGEPTDPSPAGRKSSPHADSISEIIDLERSQIGNDLHDLLLPLVFAASANLQAVIGRAESESASPAAASSPASASPTANAKSLKRLRESQDLLQQALQLGRNLLTEIYPAELDQLTWLAAAKETARRLCGEGIELIWIVDPASPICDPKWDRDLAATAYRILVESLRNASRHGQATKITIYCQPDALIIVDDGIGFRPQDVPAGHFGIRSMKGRARLVGRTVIVDSQPGGPTKVTFTL